MKMKLVEVKKVNFFAGMDKDAYDREVAQIVNKVRYGGTVLWRGRKGYFLHHHSARCMGYVSRKNEDGVIENYHYKGRFGEGVTVKTPAWDSTRYCYREYYIFQEVNSKDGYEKN